MSESIDVQKSYWNRWLAQHREAAVGELSLRQAETILGWLASLGRGDLRILEVGCGSGWFADRLSRYGPVSATDLADEVVERARARHPQVVFRAGDFMELDFPARSFDVITNLEVLTHVADQPAFVAKIARLLKPGGHFMIATQNAFVRKRMPAVAVRPEGQLRHWVTRGELTALVRPHFEILRLHTINPGGERGILRFVNSLKLNRLVAKATGQPRLDRLKEKLGFGRDLMLWARVR